MLLDLYDIEIKPSLDEQQLVDEAVIQKLVDLSGIYPDETVLEIGPGIGNITALLIERAGKVIAVEKNFKYLPVLRGRFGKEPRLETIHHDVLFYRIPAIDRVVSNLPYMISEAIIRRLFKASFKSAAFLVSSGFAKKITAEVGDESYSKLSFLVALFYVAKLEADVPNSAYLPTPNVSTAIVTLQTREPEDEHHGLMQALFKQEDKKTANALREALIRIGVSSTKREARSKIVELNISTSILEAPLSRLSLKQILEIELLTGP